jgi:hypothetical protein
VAEADVLAVDQELAARRMLGAGKDVEQLVLALAFECDDAEHLAGCRSNETSCSLAPAFMLRADRRTGRSSSPLGRPLVARPAPASRSSAISPSISSTISLLGAGCDVDDADRLAVAQDGGAVADGRRSRSSGGR